MRDGKVRKSAQRAESVSLSSEIKKKCTSCILKKDRIEEKVLNLEVKEVE